MSKATRIRQQNARERIAAQRAAARRNEIRNQILIVSGSVLAVIAIVVVIVVYAVNRNSGSNSGGTVGPTGTALPASVMNDVRNVPESTLNSVGMSSSVLDYTQGAPIEPISDKPLTSNGKPDMLYIGAEFCPYCAAERWGMAIALSRFGTFSPLRGIHSSSTDVDPSTPTLTFYRSTYTSPYLVFTPVENETVDKTPLQNPTSAQEDLWVKYDTTDGEQGYPFIDFGNKYVIKVPSYDPGTLAKMSWTQVASALQNPSSPVAQGADGTANLITAAICKMTGGQPGNVCDSAGVKAASAHL
jgi:hypothetical protein